MVFAATTSDAYSSGANNRRVTRTKLADAADWLGRGLMDQVRDLGRALEPRLGMLEKR